MQTITFRGHCACALSGQRWRWCMRLGDAEDGFLWMDPRSSSGAFGRGVDNLHKSARCMQQHTGSLLPTSSEINAESVLAGGRVLACASA
eukprot:1156945-Pelagomonas_calceolata.AAC.8